MFPDPHSAPAAGGILRAEDDDTSKDRADAGGMRITVGGGDDQVVRIQLAARWAETFAPQRGDSLRGALERFRRAYEYLDAVTHGIEPQPLEEPQPPAVMPAAAAAPVQAPPPAPAPSYPNY